MNPAKLSSAPDGLRKRVKIVHQITLDHRGNILVRFPDNGKKSFPFKTQLFPDHLPVPNQQHASRQRGKRNDRSHEKDVLLQGYPQPEPLQK
jgi:hypothetical protein